MIFRTPSSDKLNKLVYQLKHALELYISISMKCKLILLYPVDNLVVSNLT